MSYYMPPNTFLRTDSIFNKGEKPIFKDFSPVSSYENLIYFFFNYSLLSTPGILINNILTN